MKKIGIFGLLGIVIVLTALSIAAAAADWPMFRNDASNSGSSSETINLPLTEQWHSSAPHVEENGAVVSNGIVYMSSEDGKLYAFVVATGGLVTGFPVNTAGNYGSPAVDAANKKVYVLAGGSLLAFNLDGTTAWSDNVGSVGYNLNEGPIIDGGYVYVKAGGNLRKYNYNGGLQWSSPSSGTNTQPSIMGDYVYTNSESGQIRKYNKATGVEIIGGGFPINTVTSAHGVPTTKDGKIFFVHGQVYAYDADSGYLAWSKPASLDMWGYNMPAVSNGVVYIYGGDGKIYAFDENTGATMAGFPSISLNPSGGRNWNSPAVAGDKVFIGAGTTQKLKVLGAAGTANAGLVLEEHLTFSSDPQGFDLCSPVISDGVVFAMLDGGGLYAFFASGTQWEGGAITINDGAECTGSHEVTLSLDRGSNDLVNEMRISEDPLFTGAVWEPYSETKAWTLSAGFGTKTVYVQFKDSNGQLSNVFNDQIEYSDSCAGAATVTKDFRHTNVNFVPMDPGQDGILGTQDDVQLPAILGGLLPDTDTDGKYDVKYVLKPKDGTVSSTNPGQAYGVITIMGAGVENVNLADTFGTQFDVNPGKLGGGVEVIRVASNGLATVLTKTTQVTSASVDNSANTVNVGIDLVDPLGADEKLMIYIKYQTALKGLLPDWADFINNANVVINGNPETTATATIEFV